MFVVSVNRADGISEIEGKAAMGSGERPGKCASFKSVVLSALIGVHSWLNLCARARNTREPDALCELEVE
jgi:hypothetical protein